MMGIRIDAKQVEQPVDQVADEQPQEEEPQEDMSYNGEN